MATFFPTQLIELLKEQEASEHLIDLVSMDYTAFKTLVGRNIENGAIYKQFISPNSSNISPFRYAFAAGLISKADADFLDKFAVTHIAPNPGPI